MGHVGNPRRLRVLLVPDAAQWIQGAKARAIADANPWIEPTIISEGVIRRLFPEGRGLLGHIDLVHFLWQSSYGRIGRAFVDRAPCACAIAHVEDWERSRVAAEADAVMYLASEWRDDMIRRGVPADRLHHLPNGADTNLFRPASPGRGRALRKAMGLSADAFVVGFAAKRSSDVGGRKGVDVFSRSIRALHARLPAAVPLIVGPGWTDLVRRFRRDGIRTVWRPFIPDRRRLARAYQCMDVFWITSRCEGGPATLLEAMAGGVCCVTTPVGMARDLVRDGENAILVPRDDAEAFVRKTADLAAAPARRRCIGRCARRTIRDGYQWRQTARAAAGLYTGAIRRFSDRTGRPMRDDLLAAIDPDAEPRREGEREYLSAVPSALRRRVRAAEAERWMRHIASLGDWRAVVRCAAREPWNADGWLGLMRAVVGRFRRH